MQLSEGYKRPVRILGLVLIGYGLGLPTLRAIVDFVSPPQRAVIINGTQERISRPDRNVKSRQTKKPKSQSAVRPETVPQSAASADSQKTDEAEAATQGSFIIYNHSSEDRLQLKIAQRPPEFIQIDPDLPYGENFSAQGYRQYFQGQTIVLVGLEGKGDCKAPVLLAVMPQIVRRVEITIEEDAISKCRGVQ